MVLSRNIRFLRKQRGWGQDDLATRLGYKSYTTIQKWESGVSDTPLKIVHALADLFQIDIHDLTNRDLEISGSRASSISGIPNIIPMPEKRQVPLLGTIACGEPILATENIEDYVAIPKELPGDFALTCKGDSMINARIFDGDIVYIRQQDTVENGEIAAVLIDNEATLKRVRLFDDHIVLEPENPMYKPLVYWGEEMNLVRILGKAVAFTSAVR